jgi:hypothetical protein
MMYICCVISAVCCSLSVMCLSILLARSMYV